MEEDRFENLPVLFSRLDTKKDHWAYPAVGKMGLINSITRKWLESGAKESPEEMIDYIMSFITLF